MITALARRSLTVALASGICWSNPALADLAQLGDAMADVVTFGAWGQSRDQANAEIERLKLRFAEELQRAKNKSDALVATTRIQERTPFAIDSQQVGQELLKVIASIDVLLAQEKEIIVERYQANKSITRFSDWFDAFVQTENDQLESLVRLVSATTVDDSPSRQAALEAMKLARVQRDKDVKEAEEYLKQALSSVKSDTVSRAMMTLSSVRNQLVLLLEGRRRKLHELIDSMVAEDRARRALCAPPYVLAVACKADKTCRYYSADPTSPLPCGDLVYLNVFPVEAIQDIFANLDKYGPNADFFVNLGMITSTKPITETAFRSPEEIFGDELLPPALLPKEFLIQQGCGDVEHYKKRLFEAFDYLGIFELAQDRDEATRAQIKTAIEWRPIVEFWISSLESATSGADGCSDVPPTVRKKLRMLMGAIVAIERFGDALTSGDTTVSGSPQTIEPLQKLTQDF